MGLDEIHLLGQTRGVITDVGQRTLVDFLPKRDKGTVARRIARMPHRDQIELVTMDMWRPYWTVVHELVPKAQVVVDRWHVQRYANEGLERVRKSLRAELPKKRRIALKDDRRLLLKRGCGLKGMEPLIVEAWCNEFPQFGAAYRAKEGFAAIWGWGNEADARAGYEAWVRDMPADIRPTFQPLITAITNWEAEVFAYFRHPITNAFTECMNGLIRLDSHAGRGFSFEALRAKILLKYSAKRAPRPKFDKVPAFPAPSGRSSTFFCMMLPSREEAARWPMYGADLDELADLIQAIERGTDQPRVPFKALLR